MDTSSPASFRSRGVERVVRGQPIAQYGPFVMNTTAELQRAVSDFQRGVLAA